MATSSGLSITNDNTSDATFRLFGSTISAALAAVGLIRTADTGTINWTTVTRATTPVNTSAGFEIYRFSDTLQATKPVFIKIEYGYGNTTNAACIWVTVGTGTDGAGNLTGQIGTRTQLQQYSGPGGASLRVSGSTNRFVLATNNTGNACWQMMSVERSRADDGTESNEGIITVYGAQTLPSGWRSQFIPFVGSIPNQFAYVPAPHPGVSTLFGLNLAVAPLFTFAGKLCNPGVNLLTIYPGDVGLYAAFPVPIYGTTYTFLAFNSNDLTGVNAGGLNSASGGVNGLCIRWE